MKTIRYFLGLFMFLALFSLGILWSGGNPLLLLWDIPSLLFVPGFALALLRSVYSFREMGAAFRTALGDESNTTIVADADTFFSVMGKYLTLSGIHGVLVGAINILVNLTDKAKLGPCFAVALITAFYSVFLQLAIVVPLRSMLKRKHK